MTRHPGILALIAPICALLASCGSTEPPKSPTPAREDWKIHSRIVVRQGPLEPGEYQLIVPFVLGDMYGNPDSNAYIAPPVSGAGNFELDLNLAHDAMLAELAGIAKTRFRDNRMSITPADARIATVSPEIVDKRSKALGITNWVDAQSGHRLRLMYFDRPAHLVGHDFDVEVSQAGYAWVEDPPAPGIAHVVPQPNEPLLAFFRK